MAWWNSRPFVVGLATLLFVFPLTLLARIDSLQYSSATSLLAAAAIVVFLVALAAVRGAQGQLHAPRLAPAVYSLDSAMAITATIPVRHNVTVQDLNRGTQLLGHTVQCCTWQYSCLHWWY